MEAQRKEIPGWILQERTHELALEGYTSINQLKESEKCPSREYGIDKSMTLCSLRGMLRAGLQYEQDSIQPKTHTETWG